MAIQIRLETRSGVVATYWRVESFDTRYRKEVNGTAKTTSHVRLAGYLTADTTKAALDRKVVSAGVVGTVEAAYTAVKEWLAKYDEPMKDV